MATHVKFVVDQLVEKCTELQIGNQLKGESSYCRNMYIPQRYDDKLPTNPQKEKKIRG